MGSIIKAIKINHFDLKKERGWDKTYWAIDIHGTILKPNYQKGNIPKEFYPYAIECLQYLTQRKDIVLIKYTCSHLNEIEEYKVYFESLGIKFDYVNVNPEILTRHDSLGNYDQKPYFNVLFEDKAGFDPEVDWKLTLDYLKQHGDEENNQKHNP